ncbi:MlaD family protein [Gordonia terrae]
MSSRSTIVAAIKVAAVAVLTAMLFVLVVNAMRNPVDAEVVTYRADFTDASGLHENGDVRVRGKRIGKISSVELERGDDGSSIARVEFTMDKQQQLTSTSTLAIKYQNLTGVRYLDLQPGDTPGTMTSHATTAQTMSSFDITSLYNGLQPVLTTMNAKEVNQFSENAIALLQGDGTGLGPMLESTQKLAEFAEDRQRLISTLTANLSRIADTMGGRSPQVMQFLEAVNLPINRAMTVLDEFAVTATAGPALFEPIDRLLVALGFNKEFDVDVFLKSSFKSMEEALKSFQLIPGALAGLRGIDTHASFSKQCPNGRAHIPSDVRILMTGSEVVLCNR